MESKIEIEIECTRCGHDQIDPEKIAYFEREDLPVMCESCEYDEELEFDAFADELTDIVHDGYDSDRMSFGDRLEMIRERHDR